MAVKDCIPMENINEYNELFDWPIVNPNEAYMDTIELAHWIGRMHFNGHQMQVKYDDQLEAPVKLDLHKYQLIINHTVSKSNQRFGVYQAFQTIITTRENTIKSHQFSLQLNYR